MKRLLLLLFMFALAGDFNKSYSWDSTAAKFYPLAVGNVWSYRYSYFMLFTCMPVSYYDYIVRIDSLLLKPNGKWYFKFSDGSLKRIDSATMNVYSYNGGIECLKDSLLARKNDTLLSCSSERYYIADTSAINFAGTRRAMKVQRVPSIGIFYHQLVYGLGFFYEISCEGGGRDIRLNGCIINGIQYGNILGINYINSEIPDRFSLSQNYPNPFNPITKLKFQIPKSGLVKLIVFDVLGKEVQVLVNQHLSPGTYEVDFDGSNLPSGVYYYKIETEEFAETKKMVLLK